MFYQWKSKNFTNWNGTFHQRKHRNSLVYKCNIFTKSLVPFVSLRRGDHGSVCALTWTLTSMVGNSLYSIWMICEPPQIRAGKNFSLPLATMEPLPKNQSPNWNQDSKPGRQSRTPKRRTAKRCKKKKQQKKTRELQVHLVKDARHLNLCTSNLKYLQ